MDYFCAAKSQRHDLQTVQPRSSVLLRLVRHYFLFSGSVINVLTPSILSSECVVIFPSPIFAEGGGTGTCKTGVVSLLCCRDSPLVFSLDISITSYVGG